MEKKFAEWLDGAMEQYYQPGAAAYNFNLYEEWVERDGDEVEEFAVQIIGAPSYTSDSDDWACREVFTSGEDLFKFVAEDWETCMDMVKAWVEHYFEVGQARQILLDATAVTYGFVDGDLEVIRRK